MKSVLRCISIATALACGSALAQSYPTKTVRIITLDAGASVDFGARLLAQGLQAAMGQTFIVENRPGAASVIAAEAVKSSTPDGYTLGFFGPPFWIAPLMRPTPYDLKEFAPVVHEAFGPNIVAVHPSLPVKSVKELIALAKAKPGELSWGGSALGSGPHLAGELFKSKTGINIVNVPYKGGAATVNDLLAGRLQFAFVTPGIITPLAKAGKVRLIAVTTAKPSALFPDLPVMAETLPGFDATFSQGMFAPAKVNKSIITQLNQESVKYLNRPDIKQKFLEVGMEVKGGTPEDFDEFLKAEVAVMGPLIKAAGIKGD